MTVRAIRLRGGNPCVENRPGCSRILVARGAGRERALAGVNMRRFLWIFAATVIAAAGSLGPVSAQESRIDSAFSDEIIRTLGYPEIEVAVSPEGVEAPSELVAGPYLVTLSVSEPYIAYLNVMQAPDGLSEDEAIEQALAAGRDDLVQPGWVYAGGTNTPNVGETASFIIDLHPGEYQLAAAYYTEDAGGEDETMTLVPLTVTEPADGATPAVASEPAATITLEQTDELQYIVTPDPVPAGPQIWKISNTGEMHAHHVVMVRLPDGTTAQEIIGEFNAMFAGTPPARDAIFNQFVWVGYAALQSGGWTTWAEFDLKSATYAVICFIIDPETGRPHAADGMVTVFDVA